MKLINMKRLAPTADASPQTLIELARDTIEQVNDLMNFIRFTHPKQYNEWRENDETRGNPS